MINTERLTNIGSNGEIWITDNDETRRLGRKESAYKKLAEYEDLEERLNGVSVKQVVDGFIKTVENQTNEEYEHGRILTNAEADKWNEYKQLEEQGLLMKLPCIRVYYIVDKGTKYATVMSKSIQDLCVFEIKGIDKGGYYWSTQEQAEQKLKEMESESE